jgi:hypothetical protein
MIDDKVSQITCNEYQLDVSTLSAEEKKAPRGDSKNVLADIPETRKMDVVWHALDAFVPILDAHPSLIERIAASIRCWPRMEPTGSRRQVRVCVLSTLRFQ